MVSEWPDPLSFTWAMASSRVSTTLTDIFMSRNSVAWSAAVASPIDGTACRARSSPSSSTPASAAAARGRNSAATAEWTTSDSRALHTPGRWVLPLTTMFRAAARSAEAST